MQKINWDMMTQFVFPEQLGLVEEIVSVNIKPIWQQIETEDSVRLVGIYHIAAVARFNPDELPEYSDGTLIEELEFEGNNGYFEYALPLEIDLPREKVAYESSPEVYVNEVAHFVYDGTNCTFKWDVDCQFDEAVEGALFQYQQAPIELEQIPLPQKPVLQEVESVVEVNLEESLLQETAPVAERPPEESVLQKTAPVTEQPPEESVLQKTALVAEQPAEEPVVQETASIAEEPPQEQVLLETTPVAEEPPEESVVQETASVAEEPQKVSVQEQQEVPLIEVAPSYEDFQQNEEASNSEEIRFGGEDGIFPEESALSEGQTPLEAVQEVENSNMPLEPKLDKTNESPNLITQPKYEVSDGTIVDNIAEQSIEEPQLAINEKEKVVEARNQYFPTDTDDFYNELTESYTILTVSNKTYRE
ncbi:hypothetical protein [Ureibacillus aquaedulcis]|uniref:Uncharacterized protein n=1 Tax=Ureibacillus aquaedulcis TaxID=3058421 RepID=A0ABT8GUF7_9BACL|nr:hypothetical protein [Ureibacillus sp. BA0131]MDN4494531.1 hypothetical protein [Ureibacillus sp. BA0131]